MNIDLFFITVLLFLVGFLTMKLAEKRGRNGPAWFFLGILGGVFAVLALLLMKPIKKENTEEEEKEEFSLFPFFAQSEDEGKQTLEQSSFEEWKNSWDPSSYEWYYLDQEKKQQGPLTFRNLASLWLEGKISADTFVWYEDLSEWKHLKDISDLWKALDENAQQV